ncbi:hypothetical protein ABIB81_009320 [Bradyrhizobium sp. I1.7.5]
MLPLAGARVVEHRRSAPKPSVVPGVDPAPFRIGLPVGKHLPGNVSGPEELTSRLLAGPGVRLSSQRLPSGKIAASTELLMHKEPAVLTRELLQ